MRIFICDSPLHSQRAARTLLFIEKEPHSMRRCIPPGAASVRKKPMLRPDQCRPEHHDRRRCACAVGDFLGSEIRHDDLRRACIVRARPAGGPAPMQRRTFLTLSAAAAASAALPLPGARRRCRSPTTGTPRRRWTTPPSFVKWMQENRGEDPQISAARASSASRTWSATSTCGRRATSGRSC